MTKALLLRHFTGIKASLIVRTSLEKELFESAKLCDDNSDLLCLPSPVNGRLQRELDYGKWYLHILEHATQSPTRIEPVTAADEYVTVTVFPTQHCPGGVGFIFEGYFGKYVYVGDMRLEMGGESGESILFEVEMDVPSMIPWRELEGADRLFMDTTFASAEWERLPGRMHALESVLELIESKSENRQVLLECDMLGTEQVLHAVNEHFASLIYADPILFRKLEGVPGNSKFLTTNHAETRFMVVPAGALSQKNLDRKRSAKDVDRHLGALDAFALKPSTQWFGSVARTRTVDFTPKLHDGVWHVPYSIHGSFAEIKQFVTKIKPKLITPLTTIARSDLLALQQLCQAPRRMSQGGSNSDLSNSAKSSFLYSIPECIAGAMKTARVPFTDDFSSEDDNERLITHGREELHHVLDDSSMDGSVCESLHEGLNGGTGEVNEPVKPAFVVDPRHWTPNSKTRVLSLFGDAYSTDVSLSEDDDVIILPMAPLLPPKPALEEKKRPSSEILEIPLPSPKRKCRVIEEVPVILPPGDLPSIFDLIGNIDDDDI